MIVNDLLETKHALLYTVTPWQTIREAAELLSGKQIGIVLVIDDQERLLGVVSERDIVGAALRAHGYLFEKPISSIMTRDLIVATREDTLDYVIHAMLDRKIRHVPVVDGEQLVSVVSIRDVVEALRGHMDATLPDLRLYNALDE